MELAIFILLIVLYYRQFNSILKKNTMPLEYAKENRLVDEMTEIVPFICSCINKHEGTASIFTLYNWFTITLQYSVLFITSSLLFGSFEPPLLIIVPFITATFLPFFRNLIVKMFIPLVSYVLSRQRNIKEIMDNKVEWEIAELDKEIAELENQKNEK